MRIPDSLGSKLGAPGELSPEEHTLKLEILNYLKRIPGRASAEVNSLLSYIEEGQHIQNQGVGRGDPHSDVYRVRRGWWLTCLRNSLNYGLNMIINVVLGFGSKDSQ